MSELNAGRRSLLMALPVAATALAVPRLSKAEPARDIERERLVRVIEQLEASQDWEQANVVAAKAFAAWQMRKALDLDLPSSKAAQMHVDFQHAKFEDSKRTVWFDRDQEAGAQYEIMPIERTLA